MFTGIIRQTGTVLTLQRLVQSRVLTIGSGDVACAAAPGDSVCVDGACLTVTRVEGQDLTFDVGAETLRLTTLGGLCENQRVNLEPSLRMGEQIGGHFVSGHVDGVGTIRRLEKQPGETRLEIETEPRLTEMMIQKGSVAVDGISLTIASLSRGAFEVSLIPHTIENTTMQFKRPGDRVNIECDLIGRWVRRLIEESGIQLGRSRLTLEELEEQGF